MITRKCWVLLSVTSTTIVGLRVCLGSEVISMQDGVIPLGPEVISMQDGGGC